MEFFKWAGRALSSQKIMEFPSKGLDYLNSNHYPKDHPYYLINEEIVNIIKRVAPTQDEVIIRQNIADKICSTLHKILEREKSANQMFILAFPSGSCLNGTFLPDADIDIALFAYPYPLNPVLIMNELQNGFRSIAIPNSFLPVPQTKVPVLKFSVDPGIQIDISIDELHGPLNVASIRKIFDDFPCIIPGQLFLKLLLHIHGLDKPYVGGISSYTLQILILAYIQSHGIPQNITELIIGFCHFYGYDFNFTLTGIDVAGIGCFFSRKERNCLNLEKPLTMYIIDPLNRSNILGHNAFKTNELRRIFRDTEEILITGNVNALITMFKQQLDTYDDLQINQLILH